MDEVKKPERKKLSLPLLGAVLFLLGALSVIAVRFVTVKDTSVHYHANFSLYVNGQKDDFKSFTFYEEVQACSADDATNVKAKAHMHNQTPDLIHVHAAGVTWGQFFANLGYGLSNKALTTDKGVFVNDQDGNHLSFILNGQPVALVANEMIKSEDTLLINYGKDDNETIQTRADAIPDTSREANTQNDPATCSGGDHEPTFTDRLKAALGIDQNSPSH